MTSKPEQDRRQQIVENAAQDGQIEAGDDDLGDEEQADDDQAQAAHDAGPARLAEQAQNQVDGHGEDGDLDQIARADRFVELGQTFLQEIPLLRLRVESLAAKRSMRLEPGLTASRVSATSWTRHDLGGPANQGITGGGERAGQALLQRPTQHLAEKPLARHAQTHRPAQTLQLLQMGQQLQVVGRRLAEADARVEHDLRRCYTQIRRKPATSPPGTPATSATTSS